MNLPRVDDRSILQFVRAPVHLAVIDQDPVLQDYQVNYHPWKNKIEVLTHAISMATYSMKKISQASYTMLGLTVWPYRSSTLLTVVNGCATLALIILSSTVIHYVGGLHEHSKTINALDVQNREEFSSKIDQNYGDMQRSITTLCRYLDRRKSSLEEEDQGLQLLREDVEAVQALKSYSTRVQAFQGDKQPIDIESEETANVDQIQSFFGGLEKLANKGKKVTLGGALLGASYLYCAYIHRTYVMMIAGLTFFVANGLLFSVVRSYELGSRALQQTDERSLIERFNETMAGSLFPKVADSITLQKAVVIPLDKVLKIIPI